MKTRWHKRLGRSLRRSLRRRVLAKSGIGVAVETWNGLFIVDPGDFAVSRKLLERGEYDRSEIELLSSLLTPSDTIVIVGTHIGALLVPLARQVQRVFGFEADPQNFSLLELNLRLNQLANVDAMHMAVGEREGSITVRRNEINTGNSSVDPGARNGDVPMRPLDDLLVQHSGPIDLLVMDIEGYELHALRGAGQTLDRVRHLYIEFAPEQLREFGSEPAAVLDLLFQHFDSMQIAGHEQVYDQDAAKKVLLNRAGQRGFLVNLLFSGQ